METLLERVEAIVTCTICKSPFKRPKTLPCLHTFCLHCLERHILHGQSHCPVCRQGFTRPSNLDYLASDFVINSLLEVLYTSTPKDDGSGISCSNCSKVRTETGFCFDCGLFMCHDCLKAHELLKDVAFQGHKVKLTKYLDSEDYEILRLKSQSSSPQLHDNLCKVIFFILPLVNVCRHG